MKHIIPVRLSQNDIDKSLRELQIILGSNTQEPQMILYFKNQEAAKLYNNSLRLYVMINSSVDPDERKDYPAFHFEVSFLKRDDLSFTIQGNLYNAIKIMKETELMSPFLSDNMLLLDEELGPFFKQNKHYVLKKESNIDPVEEPLPPRQYLNQ